MASFSIDDVRESFAKDMTSFLHKIEEASHALGAGALVPPPGLEHGTPRFEAIGIGAHAIAGTTSLVGVASLSGSAAIMERLAETGRTLIGEIAQRFQRASLIGQLCAEGVVAMRQMSELEQAGNASAAGRIAEAWQKQVAVLQAQALAAANAAGVGAHAGADGTRDEDPPSRGGAGGAEVPAYDAAAAELREVFLQEARETLTALREQLRGLVESPGSARAEPIERTFHTLKGAAAAVGQLEVAELAKELQIRLADAVDGAVEATPTFLTQLFADTKRLFRVAGLGEVELDSDAPPARGLFVEEAMRLCRHALEDAPRGDAATRRGVASMFHHLKGSALIVGESAVAECAARAEEACKERSHDLVAALTAQVRRIGELLGFDPFAAAAPPHSETPIPLPKSAPRSLPTRRVTVALVAGGELWEAFSQECAELLDELDTLILALELSVDPRRVLEDLMRHYHTLKGAVNAIGLAPVGDELHAIEDLVEALMARQVLPNLRRVSSFLITVQHQVRRELKQAPGGAVDSAVERLSAEAAALLAGPARGPGPESQGGELDPASGWSAGTGAISELRARPGDSVGGPDTHGGAGADSRGSQASGADDEPERRYIRVPSDRLDNLMNLAGELVVSRSRLLGRVSLLRSIQQDLAVSQRRLIETVERFTEQNEFANLDGRKAARRTTRKMQAATPAPAPALQAAHGTEWSGFGALELDRYDDVHVLSRSLIEISSDFTEMDSQLNRELRNFNDDSDRFGAIVSGIRGEVTRARMVPLDSLFARLRLPVRDAAERHAKDVRVATEGEDVSLDKTIADALYAPLLHLVRNAVGHGIEPADLRARRGKPAHGTVTLAARQESGQIVLEIGDDGGGLDLAALHRRGVAMGVLRADTPVDDPMVKELVFAAGLSTTATANDVSGRGMGGSVVRRAIERLNGSIRVDSTPGSGTRFVITLPLTLAITRAILVRANQQMYAFPMYFAERILELDPEHTVESAGVRRLAIDGTYVTVRRLEGIVGDAGAAGAGGPVIVLRLGNDMVAVQVDAVVGQEEIVVKRLGPVLENHPMFAGVTIRGTGELALIVDVPGAIEAVMGRASARAGEWVAGAPAGVTSAPSFATAASVTKAAIGPAQGAVPVAAPARLAPGSQPVPAPETPVPLPGQLRPVLVAQAAARPRVRVLFIDDSVSVRKVAERTLTELGAQVTLAVDGLDGMNKLRAGEFDLVITDLEMPRMHGYELIRELRYIPAYRTLPVIVVSSRSGAKHQEQARALGADEYLTKPFSPETLRGLLEKYGRLTRPGSN